MKLEEKESEISGIYGHEFLYSVTFSEIIIPMQAHSDQYNPLNTPSTYMVKHYFKRLTTSVLVHSTALGD